MKKNPLLVLALGVLLLVIGGALYLTGGQPKADPALVAKCQDAMKARGSDASMIAQCNDTAFATTMTATDANAAAQAISGANNQEVHASSMAMFLIGIGLVFTLAGLFLQRQRRN
jgi:hypothetical protein